MSSINYQLSQIFNDFEPVTKELIQIQDMKENILKNVEKFADKNFLFLFDAIDQLDEYDYDLEFVFENIPSNAKVVYSVLNRKETDIDYEKLSKLLADLNKKVKNNEMVKIKPLKM